jgi:hypothetical protein
VLIGPLVIDQKAAELDAEIFVAGASSPEPGFPAGWVDLDGGIKKLADLSPAIRRHSFIPPS